MSEWQPIETAPKDGTKVLVYGDFINPMQTFPDWEPMATAEVSYFCNDIWNGGNAGAHDMYCELRPTHWLPLPKPPEAP